MTNAHDRMPLKQYNRKRSFSRCCPAREELEAMAGHCRYLGSPYHKKNPGDFELTPPAAPRPDKTLCDMIQLFTRAEAEALLRLGFLKGMVSDPLDGQRFPELVWAVTSDGTPLEAQLQNHEQGEYHGYPMGDGDPFRAAVLDRWQ